MSEQKIGSWDDITNAPESNTPSRVFVLRDARPPPVDVERVRELHKLYDDDAKRFPEWAMPREIASIMSHYLTLLGETP